jgi:glutathione peroxidase
MIAAARKRTRGAMARDTFPYDMTVPRLDGTPQPLSEFRGRVLLVVNVASRCGFTPQYRGLEALHEEFGERGFSVLGFPCNQFMHQEPGDAAEIARFCELEYGVRFPMFEKVDVNGAHAHPLWQVLRRAAPGWFGDAIKWNFTKFLVERDGRITRRYAPMARPEGIREDVARRLPPR